MQTMLFTAALALAALTATSSAFAGNCWSPPGRTDIDQAPINRPQPGFDPVMYSLTDAYHAEDGYLSVRKRRRSLY